MNKVELEKFIKKIPAFSSWNSKKQVDYLAYFLIKNEGLAYFTIKQMQECFGLLSIKPYDRLARYLSENAQNKNGKYIKKDPGYTLELETFDQIKQKVENEPIRVEVSEKMKDLLLKVKDPQENTFLLEAIDSFSVRAYRATIIMVWILVMDHLQKYIFNNKLVLFNAAYAKSPDKKMNCINSFDDFGDMKEVKIIEVARSANIISNDVRKILDVKLGIRNSASHPSTIVFNEYKTTEFVLDLIDNIILKY